jgi:hypothetical protein
VFCALWRFCLCPLNHSLVIVKFPLAWHHNHACQQYSSIIEFGIHPLSLTLWLEWLLNFLWHSNHACQQYSSIIEFGIHLLSLTLWRAWILAYLYVFSELSYFIQWTCGFNVSSCESYIVEIPFVLDTWGDWGVKVRFYSIRFTGFIKGVCSSLVGIEVEVALAIIETNELKLRRWNIIMVVQSIIVLECQGSSVRGGFSQGFRTETSV